MDERKIPKRYLPPSLSPEDRRKQLSSIRRGTKRPFVKSFKSIKSPWTTKAKNYFGDGNTSKADMSLILSKGDKKREREIRQGLDEIFDKGAKAYFTSGSRPNQTPESWGYGRVFSVLFGGPSRDIDKAIVEKYNIPLLKPKQRGGNQLFYKILSNSI